MRLVDVDELKKQMCNECFGGNCGYRCYEWTLMNNAPTVDPVKHGEWRYDEALELEWCSECGFGKRKGDKRWYSYCPNCGCKMEVVKHETD